MNKLLIALFSTLAGILIVGGIFFWAKNKAPDLADTYLRDTQSSWGADVVFGLDDD